ncbi:MAG TPA: alpha-amylase family glycosyl hydrolase, partial [Anaerolineales bacterium]|nr:alpha-amylase family glycosyl hydrolase [Anaerolineales bacterium]
MSTNGLDRRGFLRLFAVAAASAAAAACGRAAPDGSGELLETALAPPASPTSAPSPTAAPQKPLLTGQDAEVWANNKAVQVSAPPGCDQVFVYANGQPVEAARAGESYNAELPIQRGENRVWAICRQPDGDEVRSNMVTYEGRLREAPKAIIKIAIQDGRVILDGGESQPSQPGGRLVSDHVWTVRPGNPAPLLLPSSGGIPEREFSGEVSDRTIVLLQPVVDGEYYVRLLVKDEAGRQDRAEIYFVVENGQPSIPDYATENTAWVEQAIIYGVIPNKFGRPAFKTITERLPYLAELGVNALWLAPVNVSPPDDYGYAVVDYFDLNRSYGSKEDFHRLVQEAHALGIRVLMDFVPNHSSAQHPYYQDALRHGKESEYYDFYHRDESSAVTHYFDWTHLPNLNYDNPQVVNMMLEAFSYWVREFDVDGFRVDVAWGIRQRNPEFWPRWREELMRIKPDLLLLAEASARDPYYFDYGFDAAYDWTDQLGHWAWELVWDSYKHRQLAYNLHDALTNRPQGFHPDALIFRFLNNNDTGERFITKQGEAMARISTVMLLTLPGIPCIYTGDEIGAEFHPYQNPEPLSWIEQYPGLRDFHKQLI